MIGVVGADAHRVMVSVNLSTSRLIVHVSLQLDFKVAVTYLSISSRKPPVTHMLRREGCNNPRRVMCI